MDAEAEFTVFVRARSSALLRSACLLSAGDRQAAEDLVQSALAHAYVRWKRIREPNAREAYVRQIMFRMAIRRSRRKSSTERPTPESSDDVHGVSVLPQDVVAERLSMWPLLQGLTAQQRAVVVLRYYEDLTDTQIAAVLGCAQGTVKSHANRALRSLRTALDPSGSDGAGTRSERSGTGPIRSRRSCEPVCAAAPTRWPPTPRSRTAQ